MELFKKQNKREEIIERMRLPEEIRNLNDDEQKNLKKQKTASGKINDCRYSYSSSCHYSTHIKYHGGCVQNYRTAERL